MTTPPPPPSNYVPGSEVLSKAQLGNMREEIQRSILRTAKAFHAYVHDENHYTTKYDALFDALRNKRNSIFDDERSSLTYDTLADMFERVLPSELDEMLAKSEACLKKDVKLYHDVKQNMTLVIPTRHTPMTLPSLITKPEHDEFHDMLLSLYDATILENASFVGGLAESRSRPCKQDSETMCLKENQWFAFHDNDDLVDFVNKLMPTGIKFDHAGERQRMH